ncbi:HEAT repeat domain-containing protein [Scytonema sp. UIC 10036]|uniref:HEAT repeat domain-containing protein n=1 Tax=Scytonema sp. UIC 10036 TaxID=2304196 RepID=UPI0012DAC181|nr:HEAT repeat domain-containing protein [Scytonema sp. UIC 10036]
MPVQDTIPIVIVTLQDRESFYRTSAANALAQLGSKAKVAISALIDALKEEDEEVRSFAAHALQKIGLDAKVAIPTLISALKDQDENVRASVAYALDFIAQSLQQHLCTINIPDLQAALVALEGAESQETILTFEQNIQSLRQAIATLKTLQ